MKLARMKTDPRLKRKTTIQIKEFKSLKKTEFEDYKDIKL